MKVQRNKNTTRESALLQHWSTYAYYGLLLLVVLFFGFIRFRLRDAPLERDEGEYAYAGQLILQGIPPYQLAYNMKLPGTYAAYALVLAAFGQTSAAIHIGLLLINAATTVLVYFLGRRLSGQLGGVVAAATYALLSASPSMLGLAGHATHFVVLPALGGILLLLKAINAHKPQLFFWSGLLLGLAFLMKQPGILFLFFAVLYLLKTEWKRPMDWAGLTKRMGSLLSGAALPFALTCVVLLAAGVFKAFWFWTFSYAQQYAARLSLAEGFSILGDMISIVTQPATFVWIIAAVGITALFWNRDLRTHAAFIAGFAVFSFLAVCPGFYFRQHYFILLLPAAALLAGVAIDSATQLARRNQLTRLLAGLPTLVFLGAFLASVVEQRVLFFEMTPTQAVRDTYASNPFPEAVTIANYLAAHMPADGRIAILGSEPEIYFYSRRHSASGYIYVYPLMEDQPYAMTMQKEMIGDIEKTDPEFLLFVEISFSWLARPGSPQLESFLSWADRYISGHYQLVGIADIIGPDQTEYRWDDEARTYQPQSGNLVRVFRRNN